MTFDGIIIKAIAGFFYVHVNELGIVECHAKGVLRRGSYRPLVGDRVTVAIHDMDKLEGNLVGIGQRKNSLIRPEVANIDMALIVFAFESPEPNWLLLDRFIIMLERQGVKPVICFNKLDVADDDKKEVALNAYGKCGLEVMVVSAKTGEGIDSLCDILNKKVTAFAGPSGVGKSSLINVICPEALMETGDISKKTERGRHTTRHSELFSVGEDTFIMDTPGFTALELFKDMEKDEIKAYYREFYPYEGKCRFDACSHTHEPGCAVKDAVFDGEISKIRYTNYVGLYNEIKDRRKY